MYLHFDTTNTRGTRISDKIGSIRDELENWTHCLQNGYVSCSCITTDLWLVALKRCCQSISTSKPRASGIKI